MTDAPIFVSPAALPRLYNPSLTFFIAGANAKAATAASPSESGIWPIAESMSATTPGTPPSASVTAFPIEPKV